MLRRASGTAPHQLDPPLSLHTGRGRTRPTGSMRIFTSGRLLDTAGTAVTSTISSLSVRPIRPRASSSLRRVAGSTPPAAATIFSEGTIAGGRQARSLLQVHRFYNDLAVRLRVPADGDARANARVNALVNAIALVGNTARWGTRQDGLCAGVLLQRPQPVCPADRGIRQGRRDRRLAHQLRASPWLPCRRPIPR